MTYLKIPGIGPVEVRRSAYRRTLCAEITPGGKVIVRAPSQVSLDTVQTFAIQRSGWMKKHLDQMKKAVTDEQGKAVLIPAEELSMEREKRIRLYRRQARPKVMARLSYYAPLLGVTCAHVSLRAMTTRWGSCNEKGNLSFNVLLSRVPDEVLDYIVVHELCHRLEMNHSPRFWAEVARMLPEYKKSRRWLKENGRALISLVAKT